MPATTMQHITSMPIKYLPWIIPEFKVLFTIDIFIFIGNTFSISIKNDYHIHPIALMLESKDFEVI